MVLDPSEREARLLEALVHIVDRILCRPHFANGEDDDLIDTNCGNAGEGALLALEKYGLARLCLPTLRFGRWNDGGQKLRREVREKYGAEAFQYCLPTEPGVHDPAYKAEAALGIGAREAELLAAVCNMVQTWHSPERAIAILAEYGLIELTVSGNQLGRCTDAGKKFEDWSMRI